MKFQEEKYGKHAAPISKAISEAMEKGTINLESEKDLDEFIKGIQEVQEEKAGRAASINLLNINNGKNTIEFRLANGTINPDTWIENARLFGRIVEKSEKLAQIQNKDKSKISEEEIKLLKLMEDLKKERPELEKMESLLDLLFTEEEKSIYIERYDINSKLLNEKERSDNPLDKLEFARSVDMGKTHTIDEFSEMSRQNCGSYRDTIMETRRGFLEETREEVIKGERDD